MRKIASLILAVGIICIGAMPIFSAEAARGAPGSMQFGFGGCIYPDGPYLSEAILMAQNLNLDWIQIDLSWQEIWPDPSQPANWSSTDLTLGQIKNQSTSILVSITNTPAWAQTQSGPDVNILNAFIGQLLNRYPEKIQAIELLPRANTFAGWGAQPDPVSYMNLYIAVKNSLSQNPTPILLVAGGLSPVESNPASGDINDLQFLQGLYNAGGRDYFSIISLDFSTIFGDPTQPASTNEQRTLRHYEEVRRVMLDNRHDSGIIWINHLRLPNSYNGATASEWIISAYAQLRSQLFLGVVFYDSINPPNPAEHPANPNTLLLTDGKYSPHYDIFMNMILQNANGNLVAPPGRPKAEPLSKEGK